MLGLGILGRGDDQVATGLDIKVSATACGRRAGGMGSITGGDLGCRHGGIAAGEDRHTILAGEG
ncbi:hypothetical protein [Rhizobium tumorigenes]|uniref:hypothetical protein n=1 Tax=Rhizobium tumorigenes TaxID=2041385 RepID=UPI0031334472